jgi:hypothetical protein
MGDRLSSETLVYTYVLVVVVNEVSYQTASNCEPLTNMTTMQIKDQWTPQTSQPRLVSIVVWILVSFSPGLQYKPWMASYM